MMHRSMWSHETSLTETLNAFQLVKITQNYKLLPPKWTFNQYKNRILLLPSSAAVYFHLVPIGPRLSFKFLSFQCYLFWLKSVSISLDCFNKSSIVKIEFINLWSSFFASFDNVAVQSSFMKSTAIDHKQVYFCPFFFAVVFIFVKRSGIAY